ncbi:MAG: c-type cytochrome [Pirellulaceae bacterium]|nr:c-type cytochrome [Pirellulaceae bacterium]
MVRCLLFLLIVVAAVPLAADEADLSPAQRGYRNLTQRAYLPPDFDQATFDATWKFWPEPLRAAAEKATPDERRQMAFARYGLTPRPDDPTKPLQYVVDERGNWTMNCLSCHGGQIPDGQGGVVTWPGAPNSLFALQTLTEETREVKAAAGTPFSRMDLGSAVVPLGTTNGTTNAVMFGVLLMAYRDADLNVAKDVFLPKMTHHDMDAPPWWHFRRKKMLYADGFAAKGHRGLMQFMLIRSNGPEKFRGWEEEFRDVFAYLSSLTPPKYPYAIDQPLAERGRVAFNRVCAECHGTYGSSAEYPERLIPIDELGTDPVRLAALAPEHRAAYGNSWFADYGKLPNLSDPGGYVAPPLDGIWASGPYFHNGSVPTLWHVLHPSERPIVWKRSPTAFDTERVGPQVETFATRPATITAGWEKRLYFDTRAFGKSAGGHEFPNRLSDDEKRAVLEYLKTL